ncbi:unnamed protein product [Citrullus colocynthis]|uniref:F-box domain-containing protein n=1 Tax=Citrullus colocynthis TaxID=252529 RepID=A0ABP0Z3Q0_9ROSI
MEKMESKMVMNKNGGLIPPHILQVIFSNLPISNLPTCRLVGKTWNDLVLDYASSCKSLPQAFFLFTSQRTIPDANHSYRLRYCNPKIHCISTNTMGSVASFGIDSDSSKIFIFNHCNGLMFITKHTNGGRCDGILNPMTNEFFKLPGPEIDDFYTIGFGFSPNTNQYKLFKVRFRPLESSCVMEVFRLGRNGTNQWNHFKCLPFNIHYHGAYLNGVIYWIGKEKGNNFAIYALDVETERIDRIVTSLEVGPYEHSREVIETFNGSVYVTIFMFEPSCKLQVWRMQGKDSWIRKFVIDDVPNGWENKLSQIIKTFEYGTILFLVYGDLFCLDTIGKKVKMETLNLDNRVITGFSNIDSLNFGSLPKILEGNK